MSLPDERTGMESTGALSADSTASLEQRSFRGASGRTGSRSAIRSVASLSLDNTSHEEECTVSYSPRGSAEVVQDASAKVQDQSEKPAEETTPAPSSGRELSAPSQSLGSFLRSFPGLSSIPLLSGRSMGAEDESAQPGEKHKSPGVSGREASKHKGLSSRVVSFVAGLYGGGASKRAEAEAEAHGDAVRGKGSRGQAAHGPKGTAPCPECKGTMLDAGQRCLLCENEDARVPAMPPPAPSSHGIPKSSSAAYARLASRRRGNPYAPGEKGEEEELKEIEDRSVWIFGRVLDPRTARMKHWRRFYFVMAAVGLLVHPMYLYSLSFTAESSCLYVNFTLVIFTATVHLLSTAAAVAQSALAMRTAFISKESVFLGRGELVFDARAIAWDHFSRPSGLLLDLLVILPLPEILVFALMPALLGEVDQNHSSLDTVIGLTFLAMMAQYVLKCLHTGILAVREQRINGYVFGTIWWGGVLNFVIFFIVAQALGALWYLETVSSAMSCTHQQCEQAPACMAANFTWLACPSFLDYEPPDTSGEQNEWGGPGGNVSAVCFTTGNPDSWNYGIYEFAVQLLQDPHGYEKVMYGIFFGIMTMATFGNALVPAPDLGQAIFSFVFVLFGLLLFTTLIGNIGVFLTALTARMDEMRARRQDMDWWMRRRQLPAGVQARIRQQERLDFVATRGMDEGRLLQDLPQSLKRQVKRHLCGPLVLSVPLFAAIEDDLVIDSICERLKPCVLIYGLDVVCQGEPVHEMLFIVKGRVRSTQRMPSGAVSTWELGPGAYCGEELLSWSLTRDKEGQVKHLPAATATLTTHSVVELFSLSAEDLQFVTTHYRSQFREKRIRQLVRYYSPHWRTWAAVTIQLWYRRCKSKGHRANASMAGGRDAHAVASSVDAFASTINKVPKPEQVSSFKT